jgi:Tfp pilus assembly protein PilN
MTTVFNFARRPFRDERPVLLVVVATLAVAALLLFVNARLYIEYQRSISGTSRQIEYLEKRKGAALRQAQEARRALDTYRVSSLAAESQGLLKIVSERRFSWIALLARLERVLPPEVRVSRLTPHFAEQEVTVSLGLVGKDADSVVRTIAAFARDSTFTVINLKAETTPEHGVPEGHSFEMEIRYPPPQPHGGSTP